MGVTGLTTFLSKCGEKYKEKIYISQQVVVVDGNNLMFYIYSSYDVRKYNHHLFGGDCGAYAQAVRQFFQKFKCCKIFPIVIFDGAYESGKLKTKMKRFANSLKENVRQSTPGKSYTTCLMKDVFTEIMIEQNIDHYQTEFEADDTIAFIAQRLSCPVLSSDSDFYIYANITTIPLDSINFKKNLAKSSKKSAVVKDAPFTTHVMEGKRVKLQEMCLTEFRLSDYRLLPLTAVVIGNDQIANTVFGNFLASKNNDIKSGRGKQLRIEKLMKWFGKQASYEKAREVLLETIKSVDRGDMRDRVTKIVENYMGAGGEEYVWDLVRKSENLLNFIEENMKDKITLLGEKKANMQETQHKPEPEAFSLAEEKLSEALSELNIEEDADSEESAKSEDEENNCDEDEDGYCDKELDVTERPTVPGWFLDPLCRNQFPTPVSKILYNRTVYLTPQVEVTTMPCSHAISVPIIQILGGILYGPGKVTLVSRDKYNPVKLEVPTVSSLNGSSLPCVTQSETDFRQSIPHDKRIKIILQSLLVKADEEDFIHEWPPFMKFWVATCIYYVRKLRKTKDINMALTVAIAVLLSCLKNFSFPVSLPRATEAIESSKISFLLQQQVRDKFVEKLYRERATIPNYDLKKFWRSYDMLRVFIFSQYQSVLFHANALNSILGEPLRAPKMSTLDCNIVYNICTAVSESFEGQVVSFIDKALGLESPLRRVLLRFVDVALQGTVVGCIEKGLKREKRNNRKKSSECGDEGDPEKLNRYMVLADVPED